MRMTVSTTKATVKKINSQAACDEAFDDRSRAAIRRRIISVSIAAFPPGP